MGGEGSAKRNFSKNASNYLRFLHKYRHEFKESRRERLFAPVDFKFEKSVRSRKSLPLKVPVNLRYFNTLTPCPTPLL